MPLSHKVTWIKYCFRKTYLWKHHKMLITGIERKWKDTSEELCPTKSIGDFYDKLRESSIEEPKAIKEVKCPELTSSCQAGHHHVNPFYKPDTMQMNRTDLWGRRCFAYFRGKRMETNWSEDQDHRGKRVGLGTKLCFYTQPPIISKMLHCHFIVPWSTAQSVKRPWNPLHVTFCALGEDMYIDPHYYLWAKLSLNKSSLNKFISVRNTPNIKYTYGIIARTNVKSG